MNDIYGLLAPYYDEWNKELDYAAWAREIGATLDLHFAGEVASVLDLGCGSGRMTLELCRLGYDMIGVDGSAEMLSAAHTAAEAAGLSDRCLWLHQDLRSFELYGTVEAVVCCLDTVNHLTTYRDLRQMLALVHNYLVPGGLFLFDLNSRRKFEEIYADNTYTYESEDAFCIWQNDYDPRRSLADFYVTVFSRTAGGTYRRGDGFTRERMYPTSRMLKELRDAGFTPLSVGDAPYTDTTDGGADRLYFVARAEKPTATR
ncbi:MAG: class I SAM-dependent methyltransferase [Clostridia bacterium]|nr:class I SAM-dependent methyltransferase [Clostridia bacterium]